jgi:hypothetical protein
VPDEPTGWKLTRFPECIDRWVQREAPNDDIRLRVLDWIMGRHDDPYQGMRREEGFPNLWFGAIPCTESGWAVVTCSYWIHERVRVITCNDICTLNQPL